MDSGTIPPEQANRLREQVARPLRYLNRLCERCQRLGWPVDDPIAVAAQKARCAMQDLHTAANYAGCKSGLGRAAQ